MLQFKKSFLDFLLLEPWGLIFIFSVESVIYHIITFIILFSGLGIHSFSKERNVLAFFYILYKRMWLSLRSFTFFIEEHSVLCILLRFLKKNAAYFAFFYVLYKRTPRSLRSYTFFIKEHKRMLHSFWFQ